MLNFRYFNSACVDIRLRHREEWWWAATACRYFLLIPLTILLQNPLFGAPSVRDLTPIMFDKTTQVSDYNLPAYTCRTSIYTPIAPRHLAAAAVQQANADEKPVRIEALSWLGRTTLDIIGMAGTLITVKMYEGILNCEFDHQASITSSTLWT